MTFWLHLSSACRPGRCNQTCKSPLTEPRAVFLVFVSVQHEAVARLLRLRMAAATLLLLDSAVQPSRWCPAFNATNGEQEDL